MTNDPVIDEMIEDLVSEVDDWELDILIDYSKECLRNGLKTLTPSELKDEWNSKFGDS
jgi:hypothetical protein